MNYVYSICTREFFDYAAIMIESVIRHCDCTILLYTPGLQPSESINLLGKDYQSVVHIPIKLSEWVGKRMYTKIAELSKVKFDKGDNAFVLDCDLVVQDNIFKVFDGSFDVCYTTRHYSYFWPINAGVWGFQYNERTAKFLTFYVDEMYSPLWPPYVRYRRMTLGGSHDTLDWWCDQDFLCAVYEEGGNVPFDCRIKDLGPMYNYCPSHDTITFHVDRKNMLANVDNKEYKILHFKGADLKRTMRGLAI
jgi:hypothetical protein